MSVPVPVILYVRAAASYSADPLSGGRADVRRIREQAERSGLRERRGAQQTDDEQCAHGAILVPEKEVGWVFRENPPDLFIASTGRH